MAKKLKKLKETHPIKIKFNLLEKFMLDNSIELNWSGYDMCIRDTETDDLFYIKDCESGVAVTEVPSFGDCKLVPE